jgi:hypothetical protein
MSCFMFFLVLFTSSSSREIPQECNDYVDDPGVVQFVASLTTSTVMPSMATATPGSR